jgi:hypothetical protein
MYAMKKKQEKKVDIKLGLASVFAGSCTLERPVQRSAVVIG